MRPPGCFVTQALQTPTTPVEIDLGPELSDEALQANWAKINPAAAASIATEPTTDLSSLTVRQLMPMHLLESLHMLKRWKLNRM